MKTNQLISTSNCLKSFFSLTSSLLLVHAAHALPFTFDVTSLTNPGGGFATGAQGTSGGIGWSISSFSSWMQRTTTDSTYNGFTGGNFNPALANTDRLHTFGSPFDIVFDQNIGSILFYLREDGGNSTLNFGPGMVPEYVSGSVIMNGTSVTGTTSGGVIRFSGLNTDTLHQLSNIPDGMDTAWVVESLASVPDAGSTLALLGMVILGLGAARRKLVS